MLGIAVVPAQSVPIRLPCTALPLPSIRSPWLPLLAIRLPSCAAAPLPMVAPVTPLPRYTPYPPLPKASVPVASVPMRLRRIVKPVEPAPSM